MKNRTLATLIIAITIIVLAGGSFLFILIHHKINNYEDVATFDPNIWLTNVSSDSKGMTVFLSGPFHQTGKKRASSYYGYLLDDKLNIKRSFSFDHIWDGKISTDGKYIIITVTENDKKSGATRSYAHVYNGLGKELFSKNTSGAIYLSNKSVFTGQELNFVTGVGWNATAMTFDLNGRTIRTFDSNGAWGITQNGRFVNIFGEVYDLNGKPVHKRLNSDYYIVAFSPTGGRYAAINGDELQLYDTKQGLLWSDKDRCYVDIFRNENPGIWKYFCFADDDAFIGVKPELNNKHGRWSIFKCDLSKRKMIFSYLIPYKYITHNIVSANNFLFCLLSERFPTLGPGRTLRPSKDKIICLSSNGKVLWETPVSEYKDIAVTDNGQYVYAVGQSKLYKFNNIAIKEK